MLIPFQRSHYGINEMNLILEPLACSIYLSGLDLEEMAFTQTCERQRPSEWSGSELMCLFNICFLAIITYHERFLLCSRQDISFAIRRSDTQTHKKKWFTIQFHPSMTVHPKGLQISVSVSAHRIAHVITKEQRK
jgi:hypothetical protein